MGKLDGKRAIVTGGASGIGKATARRLKADGATVTIADLDATALEAAASELGVTGAPIDVTDWEQVRRVTGYAAVKMGGLDILVTSAGVTHQATSWDTTPEAWARVLGINLTGTFLCVKAAAPFMIERGAGRIVMLGSISGSQSWSGRAAYVASKGGVIALAKSCAVDLAPHGVTVNSVSPGPIATPQTATLHSKLIRDKVEGQTPMGRYGRPEEVADVIAFLCSDDARFVTGHDLRVDGGLTAAAILYDLAKNRPGDELATPENQRWTLKEPDRSRIARGLAWAAETEPRESAPAALAKRSRKPRNRPRVRKK